MAPAVSDAAVLWPAGVGHSLIGVGLVVTTQTGLRMHCADRTKTDRLEASGRPGAKRLEWHDAVTALPKAEL